MGLSLQDSQYIMAGLEKRHKQEEDLIAEMDELDNIIEPTEAILVKNSNPLLDANNRQTSCSFKDSSPRQL